ncbi:MAG: PaaI family thioesterase [Gammaproteobacteria bacterium]|nr:PaaI family thioesterase [Gammaproteobacteria bacterium]
MRWMRFLRRLKFIRQERRIEWYPPFWLMRIKVLELGDWRHLRIRLPLTAISKNMGGAMFGGYQAALADPIAALACNELFPGYSVFTRKLSLDFRLPGDSDLELRFDFPEAVEARIKSELEDKGRSNPEFEYGLYRSDGTLCTLVHCTVAMRPLGYRKT